VSVVQCSNFFSVSVVKDLENEEIAVVVNFLSAIMFKATATCISLHCQMSGSQKSCIKKGGCHIGISKACFTFV